MVWLEARERFLSPECLHHERQFGDSTHTVSCLRIFEPLLRRLCNAAPAMRAAPGVPMRDHIQRALYGRSGYFAAAQVPVLSHAERVAPLRDRREYQRAVDATYRAAAHGWSTPAELFSPWAGRALANRVADAARAGKLAVVELGGGRGTLARDALTHLHDACPDVAAALDYHLVDISAPLAERQRSAVRQWPNARVHVAHARDWVDAADLPHRTHVHIVATELLDNLPHDLLRVRGGVALAQARVVDGAPFEVAWHPDVDEPAANAFADYQLARVASPWDLLHSAMDGGARNVWVPTVAHQILSAICERFPGASLTLADFASFHGALPDKNGPVVQRVERGVAKTFDAVERAPLGMVDIMFPTDFAQLQSTYEAMWNRQGNAMSHSLRSSVVAQSDFFRSFASPHDITQSTCQDGYNALLSDFANVNVLLADASPLHPT